MQKKRLIHRIEEFILILLILLAFFDFFELLPADLDYVKKIISWTALGYLLYKASLTKIFFNNQNKYVDFLLIVSYFMLIIKNLIIFSSGIIGEFVVFYDFQKFLLDNSAAIELYSLIIGSVLILLLSVYSSFIEVKKPSLMHIIHEDRKPNSAFKFLIRVVSVYLVYTAFFVVVFNLVMEWIAIAIDAPIIMIGVLFYLFIIIRHYRKYSAERLIYKIGEFGEKFYEKFISLFHYRRTIFLGISGMLVLHLLTDALSFVVPYIFVLKDTLYFSQLGAGHDALIYLFLEQIKQEPILEQISLFFLYLLNTIGILFLLIMPSFFWYSAFTGRKFHVNKVTLGVIFSSVAILFVAPIYDISRLTGKTILGVDIKTVFASNIIFNNFFQTLFFAFLVFIVIYSLAYHYKKYLVHIMIFKSVGFFAFYTYMFFTSLIIYYIDTIRALFNTSKFILSSYFLLFFAINILFYIVGFIMFVDEIIKEKVYKKIS